MSESGPAIDWQPQPTTFVADRGLRQDPGRVVLLVAALMLFLGGIQPWAVGRNPAGLALAYTPQMALAEGYILLVLALILAVLARGRTLVESSSRTVQLLPLVIAFVAATMWLGADRTSLFYIEGWTNGGGSGEQTVWRLVTLAAIGAIVAGMIWLELTRPAEVRTNTRGLLTEWRPSRVGAIEFLIAAALGLTGAIVGGAVTIVALGPNGSIFAVFVALFGMAAGISAGLGIVRWTRGGAERGSAESAAGSVGSKEKVSASRVVRRRP